MAYDNIASHRSMALDTIRNEAYAAALKQVVGPDSVVLDLGAGTGVLGLIAARLGARRVYLVEPSDIVTVTRDIVAANGLQDVVHCLHGRFEDVVIPEPVDIITSVMTGNFLLTEDLLPVLFKARDAVLKPGGHLIPDAAVMEAVLVEAPEVYATHVDGWSTLQQGIDLSAGRALAANTLFYGPSGLREATFLAEPASLLELDFRTATYDPLHAQVTFAVTRAGVAHGLAGWFRMRLDEAWLSTSPKAPALHWSPVFLPLDPPLRLEPGQSVSFMLDRQPGGEWNWRIRCDGQSRRHSTLLSHLLMPEALEKASPQFVPPPSDELRAAAFVLLQVDGVTDVTTIAARARAQFPSRFTSDQAALEFAQAAVNRY